MPSFEDMQKRYNGVGTVGQQLKQMSDEAMQATFDDNITTKQCYIYDYHHDDQADMEYGYNPALSETKIPVKLKFIVKTYKSMSKEDPEYHIMFEPDVWNSMSCKPDWFVKNYQKLGVEFPISLYVDIPDDRGVYRRWIVMYIEMANQFVKCGILRCNYLFQWIEHDGIYRHKRKMWGINSMQSSYTSCGTEMYNMARCIGKPCSVFLRICWDALRAVIPKHKDEICLNGKVKKFTDWVISREFSNRKALNDYQLKYC